MADALIRADKRFELLIMPGADHNPEPRRYYEDVRRFFADKLGPPR
ncbi:alpha/beta hydrolase family protein [Nannocystis pusilla]